MIPVLMNDVRLVITENCFTRVLNSEKRMQTIRDDILIEQGHMPSYTRQMAHEEEVRKMREEAQQEEAYE